MRKVRYAMVGFGGIAENRIAREGFACDRQRFPPLAEAELLGVTDINPTRREAATAMGLKWYDDLSDVRCAPAVEAVFVATSNSTHAELAVQSMEAGRHVLVEKPVATTVTDGARLVKIAGQRKLSLGVDHMMIENDWNRKARELVDGGILGQVNDSCFHMEFSFGSTPEEAATWRCARPEELGGPIGDVASHCFYMAEFMFDSQVTELGCVYYPKSMNIMVENGAYIKYRMLNGMTGSIRVGFNEPRGSVKAMFTNLGYEIYGDKGVLRSYGTMFQLSGHPGEPIPLKVEIDRFNEREEFVPERIVNIYQEVIRRHARSIVDNKPQSGIDAMHNLRLIEACHKSARQNGAWIQVNTND